MKGILFNLVEDVVSDEFDCLMWDTLLEDANIPHGYTALGNYPDEEAMALVDRVAAHLDMDMDRRQTLIWIGERSAQHFYERFPEYFHGHSDAKVFLPTLNEIIHPDVRKFDPDARPPSFECNMLSENDMRIVYDSFRPMCGLAEGLILGVARHYGQVVDITHPTCELRGDESCVFYVHFRSEPAP